MTNVTSSTSNGTHHTSEVIALQVTFDQSVTVTGHPTLALANGGTATYASGSPGTTITLNYTVVVGQNIVDLDYASTSALSAAGGTIQNGSSQDAVLTLPTPGAAGSLGANKDITIFTATQSPTLTLPISGSRVRNIAVNYTLPETPLGGSITLRFTDSQSNVTTLNLTSSAANQVVSFTIDPTTDPALLGQVASVTPSSAHSIPDEVYSIRLQYQNTLGDSATSVTASGVIVDHTAPVITRVGSASVNVTQNVIYTDAGATAADAREGDLTSILLSQTPSTRAW